MTEEEILKTKAHVRPARNGWLAVSAPGSPLRVAVIGADEQDALSRFRVELAAWVVLATRSDVPREAN